MNRWDRLFTNIAKDVANHSKDPSTKVGCVLVRDRQIISFGYNGFPRGIADTEQRLNDRPTKYQHVVHAEANAFLNAARKGVSTLGTTAYVTFFPCVECAKGLIQAGVVEVVEVPGMKSPTGNWVESHRAAGQLLTEAGVRMRVLASRDQGVDAR
jgi:dCMP deaminase